MKSEDAIVALFVPGMFFIAACAILFIVLYYRNRAAQYRHQERLAAVEKGLELPPEPVSALGRNAYLLRGLIWLFIGIGIGIFFLSFYWAEKDRDLIAPSTLGLIPIGVGVAYLIVYRIQGQSAPNN